MKAEHVTTAQIGLSPILMLCLLMSQSNSNVVKLSLLKADVVDCSVPGVLKRKNLDRTLQEFFSFQTSSPLVESFVHFHNFRCAGQNVSQTTVSTTSTQPPKGRTEQNSVFEGPESSKGNKGVSGQGKCGTDNASRI